MPQLRPAIFSFNTPHGMCQACNGLGKSMAFTAERILPDTSVSLYDSNIREIPGFKTLDSYSWRLLETVAKYYKYDLSVPISELPQEFHSELHLLTLRQWLPHLSFS